MRFSRAVFFAFLAMTLVCSCVPEVMAQETTHPTKESLGIGSLIWTFLNSPVGLALVGSVLTYVLGKVFTKKPEWLNYANQLRPLLIQAVKHAEKTIPDGEDGVGAKRLRAALSYVLNLNDQIKFKYGTSQDVLMEALTAIHAELEARGNLTKSGG